MTGVFVTGLMGPESEEGTSILGSSRTKPEVESPSIHGRKKSFFVGLGFCVGIVAWVSQPAQDVDREPKTGEAKLENL